MIGICVKVTFRNINYFSRKLTKRAEVVIFRFRQYCMNLLLFMKMKIYPLIVVISVLGMVVDHNRIFIIGMQYDWVCQTAGGSPLATRGDYIGECYLWQRQS